MGIKVDVYVYSEIVIWISNRMLPSSGRFPPARDQHQLLRVPAHAGCQARPATRQSVYLISM